VRFLKRDIYNLIDKQRRMKRSDASATLGYMRKLAKTDPTLFCCHIVDDKGKLQHLFWTDGIGQLDYQL
jgi:hypothetical protein